jgi:hypothetical protein
MDNHNSNESNKGGDLMSAMAERVFIVKQDKTDEFLEAIKKPMIFKQFFEECKKTSRSITASKKKK